MDWAQAMRYLGITILSITGVFALLIFSMRTRIKIAIEVTKEASRALYSMASLVLFPAIPFLAAMGYFAFWYAQCSASYIRSDATANEITASCTGWLWLCLSIPSPISKQQTPHRRSELGLTTQPLRPTMR